MKKLFLIGLVGCGISLVAMKRPGEQQEVPAAKVPAVAQVVPAAAEQEPAEQPHLSQATIDHIAYLQDQAQLKNLPIELLEKILFNLINEPVPGNNPEQKLQVAAANVRYFMQAFSNVYQWYNDEALNFRIIRALANRYAGGNQINAAIALATPGAGRWLKRYVDNRAKMHALARQLMDAINADRLGRVRFITDFVPRVVNEDDRGSLALVNAIRHGNIQTVRLLLQVPGISVNKREPATDGKTALIAAVAKNRIDLVDLLLKVPGINANGRQLIGDREQVSRFQDVRPNIFGETALIRAVRESTIEMVNRLLQEPAVVANINAIDNFGRTALINALEYYEDFTMAIRLLQVPGIDVNLRDEDGRSALDWTLAREPNGPDQIAQKNELIALLRAKGATE